MFLSPISQQICKAIKDKDFKRVEELFKKGWDEIEEKHQCHLNRHRIMKLYPEMTLDRAYEIWEECGSKEFSKTYSYYNFGFFVYRLRRKGWRVT